MHVREIAEQDCENLAALSMYVWLHTYAKDGIRDNISKFVLSTFTGNKFRETVKSSTKSGFAALSNEHIIGVVIVDLESRFRKTSTFGYEIETLYVHPGFQGRGVGRMLLDRLGTSIGSRSWLTTWVQNYDAIEFYKKNGYQIVGEVEFKLLNESHLNHVLSNI